MNLAVILSFIVSISVAIDTINRIAPVHGAVMIAPLVAISLMIMFVSGWLRVKTIKEEILWGDVGFIVVFLFIPIWIGVSWWLSNFVMLLNDNTPIDSLVCILELASMGFGVYFVEGIKKDLTD